mmetsp:Transcript_32731/g.78153  ORF Transcript_32731/g.78153 Transcript_32731/m.78153 type:complete len:241 (-) Transcript_32731:184-906(-)
MHECGLDRRADLHVIVLALLVRPIKAVKGVAVHSVAGLGGVFACRAVEAALGQSAELVIPVLRRIVLRLDGALVVVEHADDDATALAALRAVVVLDTVLGEPLLASDVHALVVPVVAPRTVRRARVRARVAINRGIGVLQAAPAAGVLAGPAIVLVVAEAGLEEGANVCGVLDVVVARRASLVVSVAGAADVERGEDLVLSMVPAVVEVDVALDGVIVLLLGDLDADAIGVGQRVASKVV